jgi:peptidoglycan lytic transglycosylase
VKRWLALLLGLLPAACGSQSEAPHPHYALGKPYQADGVWHYPREQLSAVDTGLAAVIPSGHPRLTANGEAFDQDALAAASPTLQLPAIARLTNLATGRQVVVRINDRGPADPGRLVAVTRRVADLLGFPASGVAPVRLHVLAGPSQTAEAAVPGTPHLAMAAAPVGAVVAAPLGPPGRAPDAPAQIALATVAPAVAAQPAQARIVPALSGQVQQVAPEHAMLWVRLARFGEYQYAAVLAARLAGLQPQIARETTDGAERFTVRIGPFAQPAAADSMLRRAIAAGVGDARIVVKQE